MEEISEGVKKFMYGVEKLCTGLEFLSEAVVNSLTKNSEEVISADACKLREATNTITRADAPHSAFAKLRRDLDFNISEPVRSHLSNNSRLKILIEQRRTKLREFINAKNNFERLRSASSLDERDPRYQQAEESFKRCRSAFKDIDRTVFEWLHIIDLYRGDIYDSTVQTIKFLQYDFLAAGAHSVSRVLPPRMEFRPMIEMTPEHLEPQVESELKEAPEDDDTDATLKILDKWTKEGAFSELNDEPETCEVDEMNLQLLMAQDFDEFSARRALSLHNNDLQESLDWILAGCPSLSKPKATPHSVVAGSNPDDSLTNHPNGEGNVRLPSTLKRVERLREKRRVERENRLKQRELEKQAMQELEREESERKERRRLRKEAKKLAAASASGGGVDRSISSTPTNNNTKTQLNSSSTSTGINLLDMKEEDEQEERDLEEERVATAARHGDVLAALSNPTRSVPEGGPSQPRAFGELQNGSTQVDLLSLNLMPLPQIHQTNNVVSNNPFSATPQQQQPATTSTNNILDAFAPQKQQQQQQANVRANNNSGDFLPGFGAAPSVTRQQANLNEIFSPSDSPHPIAAPVVVKSSNSYQTNYPPSHNNAIITGGGFAAQPGAGDFDFLMSSAPSHAAGLASSLSANVGGSFDLLSMNEGKPSTTPSSASLPKKTAPPPPPPEDDPFKMLGF